MLKKDRNTPGTHAARKPQCPPSIYLGALPFRGAAISILFLHSPPKSLRADPPRVWAVAMPIEKFLKIEKKQAYEKKLCKFLDEYSGVLIVNIDYVGSTQLQAVRRGIRGESEMLMGKNTLIRRCIKVHAQATGNEKIKAIIPLLKVRLSRARICLLPLSSLLIWGSFC
jgi:hypothetical protein